MVKLELDFDEGIILQAAQVEKYGIAEVSLDEMILTNKHIIYVYSESTGIFSKPEIIVEKIPLSNVKIVNGKAQVITYDNDEYGLGLQILFLNGYREHFVFFDDKNELSMWQETLSSTIESFGTKAGELIKHENLEQMHSLSSVKICDNKKSEYR